jgi:PPM family protein phosphatase
MPHNKKWVLRYAIGSDIGLQREVNEDSAYTSPRLLAVADGMGGHAHGEVASSVAIAAMSELDRHFQSVDPQDVDLLAVLADGVTASGRHLTDLGEHDPELAGMGTTLTAMLWDGSRFAVAHIGDSRAYLLRAGALSQITRDHTLVQVLVDEGRLLPEQAAEHPRRSMLMRALQSGGSIEPDLSLREAQPNDRYLLCSDGMTSVVSPETLQEVLSVVDEPEAVVHRLIDLAKRGGSSDNITCVVADVVEADAAPDDAGVVAGAAAQAQSDPTPSGGRLSRWARFLLG